MTNERKQQVEEIDIAILGGGPAGLEPHQFFLVQEKKSKLYEMTILTINNDKYLGIYKHV